MSTHQLYIYTRALLSVATTLCDLDVGWVAAAASGGDWARLDTNISHPQPTLDSRAQAFTHQQLAGFLLSIYSLHLPT